jgi:predicted  nucleic acid-binding Zn-ribbon protein
MPSPALVISVRCLSCGHRYAKPAAGGTVKANPGCPSCGYIGWLSEDESNGRPEPRRLVLDRRRVHLLRPR